LAGIFDHFEACEGGTQLSADEYDLGPLDAPEDALNLFSAYPSIRLRIHWANPGRHDHLDCNPRSHEMTTVATGYALLYRIGPHADRLILTTDESND